MSDAPFDMDAFIAESLEGLQLVTQAHMQTWGFDKAESWNLDQEEGIIRFELPEGITAAAPAQIAGTYSKQDGSFMWAWNHPSVEPALQQAAIKVRRFGKRHQYTEFTTHLVDCDQNRAWEFAAVTMRLNKLHGAYRGPAGHDVYVFIVFGEITLSSQR